MICGDVNVATRSAFRRNLSTETPARTTTLAMFGCRFFYAEHFSTGDQGLQDLKTVKQPATHQIWLLIPIILWVAFFFLPVLQRADPVPGFAIYALIGWPAMWPFLCIHTLSHLLFLAAVSLCWFRLWVEGMIVCLAAGAITAFFPVGPPQFPGNLSLWGAYISLIALSMGAIFRSSDRRSQGRRGTTNSFRESDHRPKSD